MDLLSDLITRIKNGQHANKLIIYYKTSNFCNKVLDVLKREGYILGYEFIKKNFNSKKSIEEQKEIKIFLKYYNFEPVINDIKRISTPGCRIYTSIKNLPKSWNGLGIYILSTSKGVLSDREARELNLGGEILCKVF